MQLAAPPRYVEVDPAGVRVESIRRFGGPWLALHLIGKLQLKALLDRLLAAGREDVPWSIMALVLVICRLCDPSSELRIAKQGYEQSALGDLLGVSSDKINDDRLYRALDQLLPHKRELEGPGHDQRRQHSVPQGRLPPLHRGHAQIHVAKIREAIETWDRISVTRFASA